MYLRVKRDFPQKLNRSRANAVGTPIRRQIITVAPATISEFQSAVSRSEFESAFAYHSSVQPVSGNLVTLLALKLNRTNVAIGKYKKPNAQNAESANALFQKSNRIFRIRNSSFFDSNEVRYQPRLTRPALSALSDKEITDKTRNNITTAIADPSGQFNASPNCEVTTFAIILE